MPVTPTYPGIYIQEAPSSSHTIVASPTNIAVFIGYTHPLKTDPSLFGEATQIFGFMDYQRLFGGFVRSAAFANAAYSLSDPANNVGDMALAVNQFFLNGGSTAYIVALDVNLASPPGPLTAPAVTVGGVSFAQLEITDEVYALTVKVVPAGGAASAPTADVIVTYGPSGGGAGTQVEIYRGVNLTPGDPNFIGTRIGTATSPVSALVSVAVGSPPPTTFSADSKTFDTLVPGSTTFFNPIDFTDALQQDTSLDKVATLNLMVLPGVTDSTVIGAAIAFCERRLAFLILDPVVSDSADGTLKAFPHAVQLSAGDPSQPRSKNAALYFPYLQSGDPFTGSSTNTVTGAPFEIPPAPTVAGLFAATDVSRGVWKAPAGFQTTTLNTTGVVQRGRMTDARQGVLNPISVNCLRDFPNVGTVVFGSRTLASTFDQQWTYVPVRRMALFLEQTFLANLKWVLFEPNAEPLWSAITMSLNAFMLGLFKQGAFQGTKPSEAFNVQCDSQTTTQADIDSGIVNIVVSFAPLKPAEFVVITIAQLAGQSQTS
jgi:hypothetical protein